MLRSFLLLASLLLPFAAQAEGKSIIVLDASGSMWGQIDGRPKLEIAREALKQVLTELPADSEVGLMAYGHREKGSCEDIELLVPPGIGTAPAISMAADKLDFLGKTPLTEAVRRAATELRSSEDKATVILITDGIETCDADPCALGRELESSGVDFTAHVVGFGLTADEGKQVACLAEETGGRYIQASDLGTLSEALAETVIEQVAPAPEPAPEPTPPPQPAKLEINFAPSLLLAPGIQKPEDSTDSQWEIYAKNPDGTKADRITTEYNARQTYIEPGDYILRTILGEAVVETPLTLTADTLAAPEITMNAARVILHPKAVAGGEDITDAAMTVKSAGGIDTTNYGVSRFYLPAGDYTLTATMGQASISEPFSVKPGDQVERDVVIGAGLAVIDAYYVEGMVLENTQHSVEILSAKQALDGSHAGITTSYGPAAEFQLPPGDYIAKVTQGAALAETPFTVKTGERVAVPVILNAGVGAVSAPGANEIEVFFAKKDLNGNRQQADFQYTEALTTTLPAGEFVAVATRDGTSVEGNLTIKAGERTELALTLP